MSILISGMKMPKSCAECPMGSVLYGYKCLAKNKQFDRYAFNSMQDWCPLIEVPEPHGRLGDLDELKTAFPCGEYVRTESVRATIDHMRTVIPADEPDMDSFIRIFEEDDEEDGMDSFIRILKD